MDCTLRITIGCAIDEAQADQDEVGEAGSDPETSGPAENLRDKAAKTTDKSQRVKRTSLTRLLIPFFARLNILK